MPSNGCQFGPILLCALSFPRQWCTKLDKFYGILRRNRWRSYRGVAMARHLLGLQRDVPFIIQLHWLLIRWHIQLYVLGNSLSGPQQIFDLWDITTPMSPLTVLQPELGNDYSVPFNSDLPHHLLQIPDVCSISYRELVLPILVTTVARAFPN